MDTSDYHPAARHLFEILPKIFNAETEPRIVAILGAAYLEEYLKEAIALNLPGANSDLQKRLFGTNGPLEGLGPRIDLAKALGIISNQTREHCVSIARIRNRFAHRLDLNSFDDDEVADLWDKVSIPDSMLRPLISRREMFVLLLLHIMGELSNYLAPVKEQPAS